MTGVHAQPTNLVGSEIAKEQSSRLMSDPCRRNVLVEIGCERAIYGFDALDPLGHQPNQSPAADALVILHLHDGNLRGCCSR